MRAVIETAKFVLRLVVLFGIPAVLSALIDASPEYARLVGIVLVIIDKFIHHLPNEYKGLVPF